MLRTRSIFTVHILSDFKEIKYIPAAVKCLCSCDVTDSVELVVPAIFSHYSLTAIMCLSLLSPVSTPHPFSLWNLALSASRAEQSMIVGWEMFPSPFCRSFVIRSPGPSLNPTVLFFPPPTAPCPCSQNHRHAVSEPLVYFRRNVPHSYRDLVF